MKKPTPKPPAAARPKLAKSNPLLAPWPKPPSGALAADALKKPKAR